MAVQRHRGVYIPQEPGKRHEPMVGPGVSVWAVIGYSRLFDWDLTRVTENWKGYLTEDDVRAAWEYYERHPEEIDRKLRANEEPDLDPKEWGLS